jgi:hypothetical protein
LGEIDWDPLRQVGKPWETLAICPVIADGGYEKELKERGRWNLGFSFEGVQERKCLMEAIPRSVSEF